MAVVANGYLIWPIVRFRFLLQAKADPLQCTACAAIFDAHHGEEFGSQGIRRVVTFSTKDKSPIRSRAGPVWGDTQTVIEQCALCEIKNVYTRRAGSTQRPAIHCELVCERGGKNSLVILFQSASLANWCFGTDPLRTDP